MSSIVRDVLAMANIMCSRKFNSKNSKRTISYNYFFYDHDYCYDYHHYLVLPSTLALLLSRVCIDRPTDACLRSSLKPRNSALTWSGAGRVESDAELMVPRNAIFSEKLERAVRPRRRCRWKRCCCYWALTQRLRQEVVQALFCTSQVRCLEIEMHSRKSPP